MLSIFDLDGAGTAGGLQKKRIETAGRDVMEAIRKIDVEANKKKDTVVVKTSYNGNKEGDRTDENRSDIEIKRGKGVNKEGSSSSKKRKLAKNNDVKLQKSGGEDSSIVGKDDLDHNTRTDDVVDICAESTVVKVNEVVSSSKKRKLLEKSKKQC